MGAAYRQRSSIGGNETPLSAGNIRQEQGGLPRPAATREHELQPAPDGPLDQSGSRPQLQQQQPQHHQQQKQSGSPSGDQLGATGGIQWRPEKSDDDDLPSDLTKGLRLAMNKHMSVENDDDEKDKPTECKSTSLIPVDSTINNFEIELYRNQFPIDLKIDHYDAMILYHEKDKKRVADFLARVNSEVVLEKEHPPKVSLYDLIHPESGKTPIGQLDDTLDHCTYVLLYVTKHFVKDAWTEFSSQTALMDAIQTPEKRWSVVPIFTESKRDASFRIPPSIRSLKGIQYWSPDKFYADSLQKLLEDKLHDRFDREKKQRSERVVWIIKRKGEERREEEERKQKEQFAMRQEEIRQRQHQLMMAARDKQHQQQLEESLKTFGANFAHKVKIEGPAESMKQMGEAASPTYRPEMDHYMQELFQKSQTAHSHGCAKSQTAPASLGMLDEGYDSGFHPHSHPMRGYSIPYEPHGYYPGYSGYSTDPSYSSSGNLRGEHSFGEKPHFSLGDRPRMGYDPAFLYSGPNQQTYYGYPRHETDNPRFPHPENFPVHSSRPRNFQENVADTGNIPMHSGYNSLPSQHDFAASPSHVSSQDSMKSSISVGSLPSEMAVSDFSTQPSADIKGYRILPSSGSVGENGVIASLTEKVQQKVLSPMKEVSSDLAKEGHQILMPGVAGCRGDGGENSQSVTETEKTSAGERGDSDTDLTPDNALTSKSDLETDQPPEHSLQKGKAPHQPQTVKTRHVGQSDFSEVVSEPVMTSSGPGHRSSRTGPEPQLQYSAYPQHSSVRPQFYEGRGPSTSMPVSQFNHHAYEWQRYTEAGNMRGSRPPSSGACSGYPPLHSGYSPGYAPAQIPGVFPHSQYRPAVYPEGQYGERGPYFGEPYRPSPGVPGYYQYYPPDRGPAYSPGYPPQPRLHHPPLPSETQTAASQVHRHQHVRSENLPFAAQEQQAPVIHNHYHYNERNEPIPTTTINYIKTAENVMVGEQISVNHKSRGGTSARASQDSQPQGGEQAFRDDSHPCAPEPTRSLIAGSHGDPQSESYTFGRDRSEQYWSENAQMMSHQMGAHPPSELTETVTADRSRQTSVTSRCQSGNQSEPELGHRDLATSFLQPHDMYTPPSSLSYQHLGEFTLQYDEQRETHRKEYFAGPPDAKFGPIGHADEDETDLKKAGPK